jgi:hypothetical protein
MTPIDIVTYDFLLAVAAIVSVNIMTDYKRVLAHSEMV